MQVTIRAGQSLWDELNRIGIFVDRPCAGNGNCGGCTVEVDGIGKVKSCQFREKGTFEVRIGKRENSFSILQAPADEGKADCSMPTLFLDLGTTTVAGYYMDGTEKKEISFINPQRRYGADVISRIKAAGEGNGGRLKELIRSAVFSNIEKDCQVYLSGNTTMLHLFEGLEVEGLGRAPYTPVTLDKHSYEVHRRGITYTVHALEGISSFVGADIVSGIRELEMDRKEEITLLVDLGTNGEMVLGNSQKLLVTSTAAGPAFESNGLALQLHASGLIDLLYEMREKEIIDSNGTLADAFFHEGYEGMTQDLIRELQMAKAAIRTGITLLLQEYGITEEEVTKVYLAGGMGRFINIEKAAALGLLPREFVKKTEAVGNTSLLGCIHYGDIPWERPKVVKEVVLAEMPGFQELYIQEMNF